MSEGQSKHRSVIVISANLGAELVIRGIVPIAEPGVRFWSREKVEALVDRRLMFWIGEEQGAAAWFDDETALLAGARRKRGKNGTSQLDYTLMNWEKLLKSEPIDRKARLVTYRARSIEPSAA